MLQPSLFSNLQHVEWASPHPALAFRPHENGDFGHQNSQVFWKRSPEWTFLKTPGCRFREDGPKRRFRKWWCHTPYCANSLRFVIVLCPCGWPKTIWISYVSKRTFLKERRKKLSVFKKIGIPVDKALPNMTRYSIQHLLNNSSNICWSDQMLW